MPRCNWGFRTGDGVRAAEWPRTGRIPDRYQLSETESADYPVRTGQNVLLGDATLILCRGCLQRRHGTDSPFGPTTWPAMPRGRPRPRRRMRAEVRRWLLEHGVETLNVAGPRESQSPGIEALTKDFIIRRVRNRKAAKSAEDQSLRWLHHPARGVAVLGTGYPVLDHSRDSPALETCVSGFVATSAGLTGNSRVRCTVSM